MEEILLSRQLLKLNTSYYGRYGGDVDEFVLLPLDANGVLFEKLEPGTILEDEVYLGEIEGKHSECFGDLQVTIVNLDELNLKQIIELIKTSDFSYFENYFEEKEYDWISEDENNEKQKAIDELLKRYDSKDSYIKTRSIHNKLIEQLKNEYVESFEDISIKKSDYKKAVEILKANGIEVF